MIIRLFTGSIRRKLGLGFSIILLCTLLVGMVSIMGVDRIQNNVTQELDFSFEIDRTILDSQVASLEVKRHEKEFLLYYPTIGIVEARTIYLTVWDQQIEQLLLDLNELNTLYESHDDIAHMRIIDTFIGLTNDYKTEFDAVLALVERRGSVIEENGVISNFRTSAHDLESKFSQLDDHQAEIALLQLRRTEKDYMLGNEADHAEDVHQIIADIKTHVQSISGLSSVSVFELLALLDAYLVDFDEMVAIDGQIALQVEQADDLLDQVEFTGIANDSEITIKAAEDDILNVIRFVFQVIVGGLIAAILLSAVLAYLTTNSITTPIQNILKVIIRVQDGDLNQQVQITSNDEISILAKAFNMMISDLNRSISSTVASKQYLEAVITEYRQFIEQVSDGNLIERLALDDKQSADNEDLYLLGLSLNNMVESLSHLTIQIRDTVNTIVAASAELQAATTQQSAAATEQNAAVTETAAVLEQIRVTFGQTVQRAQEVSHTSQESVDVSFSGQEAIAQSIEGMRILQQRVEAIADNILSLSQQTQQVGEIINSVNALAGQSKLLALNASIEAARAGEEGRGFSVVAMEVRQLAEQSREATARVRDILSEIQQATNSAVMVTEEGSKSADSGMVIIEKAGYAIKNLAVVIEDAAQAAAQIAASSQQQTNGMDQLLDAMTQIRQGTAQTQASTRQAEESIRSLNQMARDLNEIVSIYQIEITS